MSLPTELISWGQDIKIFINTHNFFLSKLWNFFLREKKNILYLTLRGGVTKKNPSRRINFSTNGYLDLPVIVPMGQMK